MARQKKPKSSTKMKGKVVEGNEATSEAEGPEIVKAPAVYTDEQKMEAMQRLVEADKEQADANRKKNSKTSKYRALFKEAMKTTGFSEDQLSWYMKNRERPPEEIDAETRGRNAIAKYMQMAIGGQLGLDVNGQSVASQGETEIDRRKDNDVQILAAAEAQGFEAGKAAANFDSNPYPAGSKRAAKWGRGWKDGQKENMGGIKKPKEPTHNEPAHA